MAKSQNTRWAIAALLGAGVLVNFFDRVNLSVAHGALQAKFGMSDVVYGYLLSAYSWTYAAMQLPSGSLLDRWGVRRVQLTGIVLWALASAMAAIAPTIALLFGARFVLGIGEAPTFPANAKAIGLWFPEQERGIPTAIFDAAAKLSIGLGTPILGLILIHFGLGANFLTTVVLSLLYAAMFAHVYRDPHLDEGYPATTTHTTTYRKVALGDLLRRRKVWGAALGSGAYNYCFYLLLTWLPVYLESSIRMTARAAVLLAGVPWLVAAAADFVIGGWLVDSLLRRGSNADLVRRTVLIGGTSLGLFIFAPALVHGPQASPRILLACLTLSLSGLSIAAPVVWTVPALLSPLGGTGRVAGIMNLFNQLAGISAPIATGYTLKYTHSFAAAFLIAGIVLVAGIASYIFLLGPIERVSLAARVET